MLCKQLFIKMNPTETKQDLIDGETENNRLKILKFISDKPKTFKQICDNFNYGKDTKERDKVNYMGRTIDLLKKDYEIFEIKPNEQNIMILKNLFKIEWETFSTKKIKHTRLLSYYVAIPSCNKLFNFYKNFKNKFRQEINNINNENELNEKFNFLIELLKLLELARCNWYLGKKDDKVLSRSRMAKSLRFVVKEFNRVTIPYETNVDIKGLKVVIDTNHREKVILYITNFLNKLFINDKFMQVALYKSLLKDHYDKNMFISLFNYNNDKKSLSITVFEQIYLMFKEMEKITSRDNIFNALNEVI